MSKLVWSHFFLLPTSSRLKPFESFMWGKKLSVVTVIKYYMKIEYYKILDENFSLVKNEN